MSSLNATQRIQFNYRLLFMAATDEGAKECVCVCLCV